MGLAEAVTAIAVFVAAVVQSGVGFGFALVAAPVLAAVAAPSAAVPTVAALSLGVNVMTLAAERRPSQVMRPTALLLVAGSVPGMVAGAVVLTQAPQDALRVLIAVVVLASVAARARGAEPQVGPERAATDLAVGAISGALATSTSINGPPLVLRLLHLRATPEQMRDTLAAVFVAAGALSLVVLGAGGALEFAPAPLVLVAAAVAGQFVGRPVFARLSVHHEQAVAAVLVLTALLALAPVLRAAW